MKCTQMYLDMIDCMSTEWTEFRRLMLCEESLLIVNTACE